MVDRHAFYHDRTDEVMIAALPQSLSVPTNPECADVDTQASDASGTGKHVSNTIEKPLRLTLDTAAAVALTTTISQTPFMPALNEVPTSLEMTNSSASAADVVDGNRQEKLHAQPVAVSLSSSSPGGPEENTRDGAISDCTSKKAEPFSAQSVIKPTQAIAPRPVAPMPPSGSLAHPSLPELIPGSFQELRAAMKTAEIPPIFRDRPYRSGKWTKEEEVYADILVELFDKGQVDERNGSSLRGFLSRKLHCTPMRISKKYAGKGIGKSVFLSKNSVVGVHGHSVQDLTGRAEYQQNMQRLKQAEDAFYRKCYPEVFIHQGAPSHLMMAPGYAAVVPSVDTHTLSMLPLKPAILPAVSRAIPQVNSVPLSAVPMHYQPLPATTPVSGASIITSRPIATITNILPTNIQPTVWQHAPATCIAWTPQYPAQTTIGISAVPPSIPVHAPTILPAVRANATKPASTYTQFLEHAYMEVAKAMQSHSVQPVLTLPFPQVAAPVTNPHTAEPNRIDPVGTADCRTGQPYAPEDSQETVARRLGLPLPVQCSANELPDFLTGFDRVKETPQKIVAPPPTFNAVEDPSQFSPTYTSRSFDDFHRLLGSDLSPGGRQRAVDLSNLPVPDVSATNHSVSPTADGIRGSHSHSKAPASARPIRPRVSSQETLDQTYNEAITWGSRDPLPSNPADSYTAFAQQGAFAVSEHSAYFSAKGDVNGDDLAMSLMGYKEQQQHKESVSSSRNGWLHSPPSTENHENFRISTSGRRMPTMVSAEPSDQGSDEANHSSGTDSNPTDGSNDSDGSYSDSSRKKPRLENAEDKASSLRTMHWGCN